VIELKENFPSSKSSEALCIVSVEILVQGGNLFQRNFLNQLTLEEYLRNVLGSVKLRHKDLGEAYMSGIMCCTKM
jgi:hypothetical protein